MRDRREGIRDGLHQRAHGPVPTPQQIRAVGKRRREAEEKLEHHLDEARHKDDDHPIAHPERVTAEDVDGGGVAAIQNDDRLTAADRVDLITNQVSEEDPTATELPNGTS
jgi:hypothetical protein